jgi:hypothetical protein
VADDAQAARARRPDCPVHYARHCVRLGDETAGRELRQGGRHQRLWLGRSLAWGARSRCRFVGTRLGGYRVFRCAFRVRQDVFRYAAPLGSIPSGQRTTPKTLYSLAYRWYRGSCWEFPGGSPRPGPYPYAIRTRNVKCPRARQWIWSWYTEGQPMPARFDCLLRSSPATARCVAGRERFSFKYPE